MKVPGQRGPSAAFLFALFCFILPFITLSCPGGSISFSGLQLATGTTIQEPQMFGEPKEKKIEAEPLASAVALCALAGLLATLRPARLARVLAGLLGGAGALLLLLLRGKIDSEVVEQGGGLLQVSYGAGYWLAFLALVAGAVLAVLKLRSPAPLTQSTSTASS